MSTHRYPGGVISATPPTASSSTAVGVWTLEEALRNKAAGNWPDGSGTDPYFNYTTLLLHGDGTNGAQNNTFLDGSTNNFTITRNGNTTQGSFDPYTGPGNWGNYFNGSTDYLTLPSGTGFNFGTSDLTIEAWVYPTARVTNSAYIISQSSYGVGSDYAFWITNGGLLQFYMTTGGANIVTSVGTVPLNTWTHVAVSRSGTAFKLFINGVIDGTLTSSVSITNSYLPATIGNSTNNTGSVYFPGYISNLRVVKGAAVYTAAFTTPTTPLVATTQTALLTCNNNAFVDQSGANYSLTRAGSTQVSKFSPFTLYQITPASYSGYFDGNGDYLSIPSNAVFGFGTGDFTVEYWIYATSWASGPTIVDLRAAAGNSGFSDYYSTGGAPNMYWYNATVLTSSVVVPLNTWTHVAYTRASGAIKIFVNGVLGASGTSSSDLQASVPCKIGSTFTPSNYLTGSISNLRITKGQALYTSAFTPSTSPLTTTSQGATAANVSLLTCQSTTFIDNSTNAFTITANGNATPKRANPFTDTVTGPTPYSTTTYGGSAYFDGAGDYLTLGSQSNFAFGTGDFTIEAWVFPTTVSGTAQTIYDTMTQGDATGTGRLGFDFNTSLRLFTGAGTILTSGGTMVAQSWQHVAVCRASGSTRLFINGAQVNTTYSDSTNYVIGSANRPIIGVNAFNASSNIFTGYMSNLRVIKGTAVYTGPFVPPAAPVTAVTNTQLLVNATNAGIFDNTTVNDLETVGAAQISTSVVKYGTGSMSFNGTNSAMFEPSNINFGYGTGDFTIEFWLRLNATTTQTIFSNITLSSGLSVAPHIYYFNASGIRYYVNGVDRITGGALNTGQWYHVAVCRSASSTKMYVDGVQSGSTYSDTNNYGSSNPLILGDYASPITGSSQLNGYLDDIRVTKGIARYTTNFTPPTGPFANM